MLAVPVLAGRRSGRGAASRAASALSRATPAYYFLLARHFESAGNVDEAIKAYKRAIALDPASAELRAELAGLYARQDNATDAIANAEAALARDAANQEANRILGTVYARLRRAPAAAAAGRRSVHLSRARHRRAWRRPAARASTSGWISCSDGCISRRTRSRRPFRCSAAWSTSQPTLIDAAILLSTAQEGAGQTDRSRRDAEKVLTRKSRARSGRSCAWPRSTSRVSSGTTAADALAKAQALNPRAPMIARRRAVALLSAGRGPEARAICCRRRIAGGRADAKDPVCSTCWPRVSAPSKDLDAAAGDGAESSSPPIPTTSAALHVMSLILQDKGDVKGAERSLRDSDCARPDGRQRAQLARLHARRARRSSRRSGHAPAARAEDRARQPVIPRQPRLGVLSAGPARPRRQPTDEAADKLQISSVVQDHLGDLRFKQRRFADAAAAWERALGGDGQSIDETKIEGKIREARGRM